MHLYNKWDLTLRHIIIKFQDSIDKQKTLRTARKRKEGYKKQNQKGKGLFNIILTTIRQWSTICKILRENYFNLDFYSQYNYHSRIGHFQICNNSKNVPPMHSYFGSY